MPTSLEEGSERSTQRIIDILQPAEVESSEGRQSSGLLSYGLGYGRFIELLNAAATLISMSSTTGTSAAIAIAGDRRLEGSTVVVDEDSTTQNQDLETGRVPDESTGGRLEGSTVVVDEDSIRQNEDLETGRIPDESTGGGVAVETSSGDYRQDSDDDNESECRICQMSSATDVVIDLGCTCKLDLGRAHAVCAETWFQFKGNRQCEICGEIAKNVQNVPDTSIDNNGHYPVDRFWWNLQGFLDRYYRPLVLIVLVAGGVSFGFIKYQPHYDRS